MQRRQGRARLSASRLRLTSRLASVRGSASAPPSRSPSPLAFTATSAPLSHSSERPPGASHTGAQQPSGASQMTVQPSGAAHMSIQQSGEPAPDISLQKILEECVAVNRKFDRLNARLQTMEDKTNKVLSSLKELNDMTKKYYKSTFKVKGSQYESPLKSEAAKLFCHSLKRKPAKKDIQEIVVKVLGRESREKYKFDAASTFTRNKLTDFRTEERRKVVGLSFAEDKPYNDTKTLCNILIDAMRPEDADVNIYMKHLAILRKYVRDIECVPYYNFYGEFREWLDEYYPNLDEEAWSTIMSDDASIDYRTLGSGIRMLSDDYQNEATTEVDGIVTDPQENLDSESS